MFRFIRYFRDANITYDIDWGTVFACTNFQSGALNLFLSHGINQDEDIAERIVEIYLRYNVRISQHCDLSVNYFPLCTFCRRSLSQSLVIYLKKTLSRNLFI